MRSQCLLALLNRMNTGLWFWHNSACSEQMKLHSILWKYQGQRQKQGSCKESACNRQFRNYCKGFMIINHDVLSTHSNGLKPTHVIWMPHPWAVKVQYMYSTYKACYLSPAEKKTDMDVKLRVLKRFAIRNTVRISTVSGQAYNSYDAPQNWNLKLFKASDNQKF